jgi:thiol-disulfide isomerase/thioredoxin
MLGLSVAGLLFAFVVAGVLFTEKDTRPENKAAPNFSLELLDGGNFHLSDHKGKPVMINFFASWCLPCREEIPALVKIQHEYQPKGIFFLAIAVDDTEKDVTKFIERLGFTFPAGLDKTGKLKEAFGVYGLPTSFFINKDATINYFHPGSVTTGLLRHELDKLL